MTEQVPPEAVEHVEPDLAEPTFDEPTFDEPTFEEPGFEDPGFEDPGFDHEDHRDVAAAEESLRTGVPAVDDVLADVDRLDDAPLDEHLAAFERAHDSLRSALDADPGEPA